MAEQKKTIIEKIQKLLELQKGAEAIGSLEEAANAAQKAQALLLKHNLEMMEILSHDPNSEQKVGRMQYRGVYAKKNEGQWIYLLYTVLAKHNFCDVVLTTFWDAERKKNKFINLIGTKENVEVVKFMAENLEYRIRMIEIKAWSGKGHLFGEKRNSFRRAYYMGACQGIDTQLQEAKRKSMETNQVYALVLANDQKLKEAMAQLFPNLKTGRGFNPLSAGVGQALGYQDGKNLNLHKSISNQSGKRALN